MQNNERASFIRMRYDNPLTRLAEKEGLLYIHLTIDTSWASGTIYTFPRYMFLYDLQQNIVKCYLDKTILTVSQYHNFEIVFDSELIFTKSLNTDISIDKLFKCESETHNRYDTGGYFLIMKYQGKEKELLIFNKASNEFQPFEWLFELFNAF